MSQTKAERFLNEASFISFAIDNKPCLISFLYEKKAWKTFSKIKDQQALYKYLIGKKAKLVIQTSKEGGTRVSLVDLESADTLNIDGPKFINGNIHKFFASDIPVDTVFRVVLMCKHPETGILTIASELVQEEPLLIHGYCVTDMRSQ